jgi:hypothetical protein
MSKKNEEKGTGSSSPSASRKSSFRDETSDSTSSSEKSSFWSSFRWSRPRKPSSVTPTAESPPPPPQEKKDKNEVKKIEPTTLPTSTNGKPHTIIFREPTRLPEEELIDTNRPIESTVYLSRVLSELPPGSAREPPLSQLSHEVVEQFGLRLVRTPAIVREVIALSRVPDPELLHKILQQFLNLLSQEAALDVDLLEGIAELLETAHPQAMRPPADKAGEETSPLVSGLDESKFGVKTGLNTLNAAVGTIIGTTVGKEGLDTAVNLAASVAERAGMLMQASQKKMGSLRKALEGLLGRPGKTASTLGSSSSTESSSPDCEAGTSKKKTEAKESTLPDRHVTKYDQMNHLIQLLGKLVDKYQIFHAQSQTALQQAELLQALARVLDAMRDIGVTGIRQDEVHKKVYQALEATANHQESGEITVAEITVSLWANYALQALIRLEDDGSAIGEWITRGVKLAQMIKSVKALWDEWDFSQLGEAYKVGKEALQVDHQPESWYESLWYCQLLIRAGDLQGLEAYLYEDKPDEKSRSVPRCPDRCLPPFQLGLLTVLDGVLRDPHWPESVQVGCLQLLQDLFLNEAHWYTEPAQSPHPTWRAMMVEKAQAVVQKAKKTFLYTGEAYRLGQKAVQSAVLDQLVSYLQEPGLSSLAQAVLLALRHPSIQPPLNASQSQLLEDRASLAKILRTRQGQTTTIATTPSQVLLIPAREAVQKHLVWKLENMRTGVLSAPEVDRSLLHYVPPKGLRQRDDKAPPFDLLAGGLHFLGLTPKDPAVEVLRSRESKETETKSASPNPKEEKIKSLELKAVEELDEKSGRDSGKIKKETKDREVKETHFLRELKYEVPEARPEQLEFSALPAQTQPLSSRCIVDYRRMTGAVDQVFVSQWRRTYHGDATRFLLVYVEQTAPVPGSSLSKSQSSESQSLKSDESEDSRLSSSGTQLEEKDTLAPQYQWYLCAQTGEGESIKGVLNKAPQALKKLTDSPAIQAKLREVILYLNKLSHPAAPTDTPDPLLRLQTPGSGEAQWLQNLLLSGLNHLAVVNGQPLNALSGATPQVLLLTAEAGSGKSTFGLYLERFLWQHYQPGGYIPVFIALAQITRPEKAFIDEVFKQRGFTDSDLQAFKNPKNGYRFLFILDGYDELPVLRGKNLFTINRLQDWPGCRVMIGCRAELLTGDTNAWFAPSDEKGQVQCNQLQTRWIAPFDGTQTQNYLKKYVQQRREHQALTGEAWDGWANWRIYQKEINRLSSIRQLIERPFMLTILVEILPSMKREHSEEKIRQINRLDLYDLFMQQWFKRANDKLTPQQRERAQHQAQERFQFHEGEPIEADYQEFCENLALYLFKNKTLAALYQREWQIQEKGRTLKKHKLDRFFKISDPAVDMVLRGCPIVRQGHNRYAYIHKSVWEYFVACRIYREVSSSPVPWSQELPESSTQSASKSAKHKDSESSPAWSLSLSRFRVSLGLLRLRQRLSEQRMVLRVIEGLEERDPTLQLLNQRLLTSEPSIIRFLADYAQRDARFARTLLYWVLCTRERPELTVAGANAITILNVARFAFSGMNLSGIRIQGADLSRGIFDHTNLSRADLRRVSFDRAFLKEADLSGSQLKGASFGLLDQVKFTVGGKGVMRAGSLLLAIDPDGRQVRVIDLSSEREVLVIPAVGKEIINKIELSPNSSHLAFLYNGQDGSRKVLVYDVQSRMRSNSMAEPEGKKINKVTLSADSSLAFLYDSQDGSREVWVYDVKSKMRFSIAAPKEEKIYTVTLSGDSRLAFLYDGQQGSREVLVYDVRARTQLDSIALPDEEKIRTITLSVNSSLAFLYDGQRGSREVLVYDVQAQRRLDSITASKEEKIKTVTLNADSSLAFLYDDQDGSCEVWVYDVKSKMRFSIATPKEEKIYTVTLSGDSRLAFLYDSQQGSREVLVYDVWVRKWLNPIALPDEEKIRTITLSVNSSLAFLYDGQQGSREVLVYDVQARKRLDSITAFKEENIYTVTLSADSSLAFLYDGQRGSREVLVYDVRAQKRLDSITASEEEKIKTVTLSADSSLAFLYGGYDGSRKVLVYDMKAERPLVPIQLPKKTTLNFLFIPTDEKTSQISLAQGIDVVFYGSGGCFIWRSRSDQLISVIVNNSIIGADLFQPTGHILRLVTVGTDGVCRLWDITDRGRPLLKYCTRGVTFYGQGLNMDSAKDLSPEDRRFLLCQGALALQEKDDMKSSVTALTSPGYTPATFKQPASPSSASSSFSSVSLSSSSSSSSFASTSSPHLLASPSPKKLEPSGNDSPPLSTMPPNPSPFAGSFSTS